MFHTPQRRAKPHFENENSQSSSKTRHPLHQKAFSIPILVQSWFLVFRVGLGGRLRRWWLRLWVRSRLPSVLAEQSCAPMDVVHDMLRKILVRHGEVVWSLAWRRETPYALSMLPRVWSSFSKVIVAALGILLSGSRVTLNVNTFKEPCVLFYSIRQDKELKTVWSIHGRRWMWGLKSAIAKMTVNT